MILFYYLGLELAGEFRFRRDLYLIPLIFILVYANASLSNFLIDRKADKLNKKQNPFTVRSSFKVDNFLLILPAVVALMLSIFTENPTFTSALILLFLFLSFLYSSEKIKASYRAIPKLAIMALGYTFLPGVLGLSYSQFSSDKLISVLGFTLLYSSYFPYGDVKDLKGDKASGKQTLAVSSGVEKLPYAGITLSLVGVVMLLYSGILIGKNLIVAAISSLFLAGHFILLFKNEFFDYPKLYSIVGYFLYLLLILLLFSLS